MRKGKAGIRGWSLSKAAGMGLFAGAALVPWTHAQSNPWIIYSTNWFHESAWNDGGMANTNVLTLVGDQWTGTTGEDFVASAKVLVSNLPAGLTARVTRVTVTNLNATLLGNALQHEWANRVTNLTFTFQDSAFVMTPAALVTNSMVNNLIVSFMTNPITYYVATNGSDLNNGLSWGTALATITNAVWRCRPGASDVVQLGTGVFNQTGISVGKAVVIRGMGPQATILQGGPTRNMTAGRFFTTTSVGPHCPIVIRDMTMTGGGTNGNGGALYGGQQSPLYVMNCHFLTNTAGGMVEGQLTPMTPLYGGASSL